jgi:hypothetical protein
MILHAGSLCHRPVLELRTPRQGEAVEKWSSIQVDGPTPLALSDGPLDLLYVRTQPCRVQSQGATREEQVVTAERPTGGVERLRDRRACALHVAFGPEQRRDLLSAYSRIAGDGEHGQECE